MGSIWEAHHGLQSLAGGNMVDPIENYIAINVINVAAFVGLRIAASRSYPNETKQYTKKFPFKEVSLKVKQSSRPGKVKLTNLALDSN